MFITFEGVEGAGKSTQIALLASRLREQPQALNVLVTREPGAGPLGKELRALVLKTDAEYTITPRAELLIMLADRAQHVSQIIQPHLLAHGIVMCDRYADSSVAYQGYGRGLDIGEIEALNLYATNGLLPDLTFLLDLDPEIGLARQSERTRMEHESLAFHQRIRVGFLALAARHPERIVIIDASRPTGTIHDDLWRHLSHAMASL